MAEAAAPDPHRESPASAFALALLTEFVALGVTDVVVAPGSRSQALALAAAEFERADLLRLHVRIDERGAGFLALGLGVETGRPAVVITTSGTAVANLHPAVLEAHHSGVPLIALTADRPAELRGIRSNQTTMQPGIFAGAVRLERDVAPPETVDANADAPRLARRAVEAALGIDDRGVPIAHPGAGPVHLNVQLREPLSAPVEIDRAAVAARRAHLAELHAPEASGAGSAAAASGSASDASPAGNLVAAGPRTLVVAGAGAGPEAEAFARAGGWPLAAEITSGAHFGPNLVVAYRELLAEPGFGNRVERVVVFGHPTLSREVPALVQRDGVESIVVAPSGIEWFNPGRRVRRFERAVHAESHVPTAEERAWTGRWVHASRALLAEGESDGSDSSGASARSGVDETGHVSDYAAQRAFLKAQLAAVREPVSRRMLVESVWSATWPHDRLVLGASRLIRDADRVVPGRRISAHANRGLAGIDGTVATAVGIAIASQRAPEAKPGTTRVLLGDLTLLHDVGSLLLGAGEAPPRVQVIVGNDGGGAIFDALEVAASAPADAFDRVQFTPQHVDLAALATAYGWTYQRAATRGELEEALGTAVTGPTLVEVPLER
ncbi:2-succinyl-5-enolpyruvyl-6-hydroxy-3-cyclohexene-1-carboxylic-acid synthase [Agromyces sp. CFH 90414]|uniref:2-succinyl-5-enolpyruvyl-6-hydroxy-3-cyclohexene-1-carboxylate synthase n=1 Tax=Agromyces agglutinans TaxID=2662258 RepID=A0A6I2F764_9MICO|nr:2-succinyl-5-enolpyruvyl-6-hydroxy-3-cyclohexene-1-carboxylic-acid synthase [Agromyces agglutinans]MRG59617.1 2-succinyl-5-enolpyruvyl-6-hydroxy-3-cyclohexene-1-carboxylic-acid synthase [Agromyces agglutinans]